jgi:hypothetical protein
VVSLAIIAIAWVTLIRTAKAEVCFKQPSHDATERRGGYRWHYRIVDGKRCYYYSNLIMPRDELVWSYTEEQFNAAEGIDRVIERKFWTREQLQEAD